VESSRGEGSTFSFTVPVFTVDSAYVDLVENEAARVREAGTCLSLIFIDPGFKNDLTREDKKALVALEDDLKGCLRRKSDLVLIYGGRSILAAVETGREGAEGILRRLRDIVGTPFEYRVAVYPDDGIDAGGLLRKARGEAVK
jgi:hypothetical protein